MADGFNQSVFFTLQSQGQLVSVGDVFLVTEILAVQEIVLFISPHLQDVAVEPFGQLKKLHGAGELTEVAVVEGDERGHEGKADHEATS